MFNKKNNINHLADRSTSAVRAIPCTGGAWMAWRGLRTCKDSYQEVTAMGEAVIAGIVLLLLLGIVGMLVRDEMKSRANRRRDLTKPPD